MKTLLLALAITLLFASLCLGQQESYAYGQPSDLKGLKKVYIDTGADTKSRDSIIKDLQKSKLSFEIMDDLEDAEILLGFGAGEVTRKATGTISGSTVTMRGQSERTGVGVVIARARGKDRLVYFFRDVQESGGVIRLMTERKPVTNFVREFIKLYKKANGLK